MVLWAPGIVNHRLMDHSQSLDLLMTKLKLYVAYMNQMRHYCLMKTFRPSTQDAIIDAAFQLYRDNPAASLADIASLAGIGRATLHRHFSSRDDLLIELAKIATQELDTAANEAAEDAQTYTEAIRLILHAMVPLADRAWFLYREVVQDSNELQQDYRRQMHEMADLIDAAKQEGGLSADQPTLWIVHSFDALLFAAWEMVRTEEATATQAAQLAWQTFIHGVGNHEA